MQQQRRGKILQPKWAINILFKRDLKRFISWFQLFELFFVHSFFLSFTHEKQWVNWIIVWMVKSWCMYRNTAVECYFDSKSSRRRIIFNVFPYSADCFRLFWLCAFTMRPLTRIFSNVWHIFEWISMACVPVKKNIVCTLQWT